VLTFAGRGSERRLRFARRFVAAPEECAMSFVRQVAGMQALVAARA